MRIYIPSIDISLEGTAVEIVKEMADNQWNQLGKLEYMRLAAKRAKIQTGKPVRPWSADLFLKDLSVANLITMKTERNGK